MCYNLPFSSVVSQDIWLGPQTVGHTLAHGNSDSVAMSQPVPDLHSMGLGQPVKM